MASHDNCLGSVLLMSTHMFFNEKSEKLLQNCHEMVLFNNSTVFLFCCIHLNSWFLTIRLSLVYKSAEFIIHKMEYRIYPKYSDTLTPYHICSKIWTSTIHYPMLCLKIAGWVANSVDPDETPRSAASHLGLYCLLRPVCPNTYGKYGFFFVFFFFYCKGSIFLKNRHFIIQERFNKLIYGINTIIKCGTWQLVKFQVVYRSSNEMIFLSYLWTNVANINSEIR